MRKEPFDQLVQVFAALRSENGCPWDREQTHDSIKPDLIEETYEVIEAIDARDTSKLREELGDLLGNVMLHAQIARDEGEFDINDVIKILTEKLIRRHPHDFGNEDANDADQVLRNWEQIKRSESGYEDRKSALDGVPDHLPNLQRAQKLQRKAARVGFDWNEVSDVLPKIDEEIAELKASIRENNREDIELEIGDLLFSIVNLCRFLDVRAEEALRKANRKFVRRFKAMESELDRRGDSFKDYDLAGLDEIWDKAKKGEA